MTYGEIANKIQNDLTLAGEDFVIPEEMLGYYNEAIRKAEAIIHSPPGIAVFLDGIALISGNRPAADSVTAGS